MLVNQWTVNWGDGSPPQQVSNQPWIVHPYAGNPANYAITVTATSLDGTFTTGMGSPPGSLDQDFDGGSGFTTNESSHGRNPNWATQNGSDGQQTTNFEDGNGFDQPAPSPWTTATSSSSAPRPTASSAWSATPTIREQPDDGNLTRTSAAPLAGLVTTTFAAGNASASAVAVDPNNATIVVAGTVVNTSNGDTELALARYNDADGSPDTTFGPANDGTVTTDLGSGWEKTSAVVVESDDSILVAGEMNGQFAALALQ